MNIPIAHERMNIISILLWTSLWICASVAYSWKNIWCSCFIKQILCLLMLTKKTKQTYQKVSINLMFFDVLLTLRSPGIKTWTVKNFITLKVPFVSSIKYTPCCININVFLISVWAIQENSSQFPLSKSYKGFLVPSLQMKSHSEYRNVTQTWSRSLSFRSSACLSESF